ncbi:MAG: hypothetical protein DRI71_05845 [Bacteroidetes bacterium]|nr:MAG: hypothetical protein DRI71_05845 [Bacteroidota bacterium]
MATVVYPRTIRSEGAQLRSGLASLMQGFDKFIQGRQRNKDYKEITALSNRLQGLGPGGMGPPQPQGPGGPGVPQQLTPQQQLSDALSVFGKLRTNPGKVSAQHMTNILSSQSNNQRITAARNAATNARASNDPMQKAIMTNSNGQEVLVNEKLSVIQASPNLRLLPRGAPSTTHLDQSVDKSTGEVRILNKRTGALETVSNNFSGQGSNQSIAGGQGSTGPSNLGGSNPVDAILSKKRGPDPTRLTIQDIELGSGAASNLSQFAANTVGLGIPGKQFKKTGMARKKMDSTNNEIKRLYKQGSQLRRFEDVNVDKLLPKTGTFFAEKGEAPQKYLVILNHAATSMVEARNELAQGGLTLDRRKENLNTIKLSQQIINALPSRFDLEMAISPIHKQDVSGFRREHIDYIVANPDVKNKFSNKQKLEIGKIARDLGYQRER